MNLDKTPATIITGFLGAGKTTLLRHLLTHAQGRRIAVIVNEFGELGIDGELLKGCGIGCDETGAENGQVIELANGCLCCTVQEEFAPVMELLAQRRDLIDHVVIETSGLALPKPLVQAFQWPTIRHAFTVDAVVTVVDVPAVAQGCFASDPQAVEAQRRADPELDHDTPLAELFEDQLATADLVVLNKVERVDADTLQRVRAMVAARSPAAVQTVVARHGQVPPEVLLGLGRAVEEVIESRLTHHDDEDDDHDHDAFQSVVLALDVRDRQHLLQTLSTLVARHGLLRIKGFVALPKAALRLVVQGVGPRLDSHFDRPWRVGEPRCSVLVCIGLGLDEAALRADLRQAGLLAESSTSAGV
ncbi:cobalamin biosynthesis protein CobW [Tepidimonas aquatica]|uniref:Putative GTP-binding protein YjiA n=1 Tax=Tepidimonas aquatica TaxID=247482 RepID=A0A554WN23_9BURK|nr:cobalamin biosynthesis protein CobW [Tepidimonas aquatica]TSE24975.1 putative GTP-binding protein YjiA [Tepidimonas aquatica]